MKTRKNTPHKRVAILSAAITNSQDGWYQLLPAGHFAARDGRPDDVPGNQWFIDATIAAQFIEATAAIGQPVLFDYNHVTLKQDEDPTACAEAKAAAWLRDPRNDMQWREGLGLFVRLSLTPAAQAAVDNGEWAYLSAVFPYDEAGYPLYLRMGALTNDPGLTGMQSMAALSARLDTLITLSPQPEDVLMNETLLQLLEKLGITLPEDTSELTEDALRELLGQALVAIETLLASAQVALDTQEVIDTTQDVDVLASDITGIVDDNSAELAEVEQILEEAALAGVDLTQFVPAKAYNLLARSAAVLNAQAKTGGAENIIATARRSGRVLAAEVPYLRTLARTRGIAALNAAIKGRPAIAAVTRRQTTVLGKPAQRLAVLSASDKEAARLQGLTEAEFLKRKKLGAKK
ncbi:phage protease [Providencia hangzhouensis]|uniref:Mu-like prophage I protein n=1 Tax=Providencia rettgeri TaxID=587 RepID=A0A9N8D2A2_PRORE|nr:phage protease [Providencia rettgeri]CAB5645953.1 Mu-like prophage I protein [Providencia rettgeri]CAB5712979.1 Mu-like prophage I protein [Providencia rettgeri]CAC9220418.1 Mu-like prophage I protein [Providencia rettgeri]CAC9269201.1 Mu-like prophage I protein [Providencia rettgeri]